jgi:hypothetical protein
MTQAPRNRLKQLLGSYHEFSDLSVINPTVIDTVSAYAQNLYAAVDQLPKSMATDDYVSAIDPYIGPIEREIASIKQWTQTTRKVAESSVLELTARQQSLK